MLKWSKIFQKLHKKVTIHCHSLLCIWQYIQCWLFKPNTRFHHSNQVRIWYFGNILTKNLLFSQMVSNAFWDWIDMVLYLFLCWFQRVYWANNLDILTLSTHRLGIYVSLSPYWVDWAWEQLSNSHCMPCHTALRHSGSCIDICAISWWSQRAWRRQRHLLPVHQQGHWTFPCLVCIGFLFDLLKRRKEVCNM